jgi:taurine dioxygenase
MGSNGWTRNFYKEHRMAGVEISDLGEQFSFGSRVSGVTWDNIHDEGLRGDLQRLFIERGLIVFQDMEPSPRMQVEVSKIFGPLKDHPTKSTPRADPSLDPGIIDMHRLPQEDTGRVDGQTELNGKMVVSFIPWHFDHSYNDELNYAGVLRSVIKAPVDGRTGFADGIEIYKALDPAIAEKIEGLNAIYTLDTRISSMRFGRNFTTSWDSENQAGLIAEAAIFPRAIHPMIWQRPTGEKVAHFCGFSAVGIEGHEDAEGEAIFEEALQDKVNPYWHDWQPTDMVIWDNHRMLHAVEGCDPKYERQMHRTTIKGDYGLGRFEGGKKIGEVNRAVPPLRLPEVA